MVRIANIFPFNYSVESTKNLNKRTSNKSVFLRVDYDKRNHKNDEFQVIEECSYANVNSEQINQTEIQNDPLAIEDNSNENITIESLSEIQYEESVEKRKSAANHMTFTMTDTGQIQYECKICDLSSNDSDDVSKHIILTHPKQLSNSCSSNYTEK